MNRTRLAAVALGLLLAGGGLAGCGDTDDPVTGPETDTATDHGDLDDETGQAAVVVQARDNTFVSDGIRVSVGAEVTFENRGRNPHNVVPVAEGAFEPIEVDDLQPGDEATVTFDEPGEYPYFCTLHGTETKGMVGVIVVE